MTGDTVLKPAWGKDQPNNYNGEQNCVVLDGGRNWLWNDIGCNIDYLHFVCQHGMLNGRKNRPKVVLNVRAIYQMIN